MTMPPRIWAEGHGADQDWGDWDAVQSDEYPHAYVRTDVADALAEALREIFAVGDGFGRNSDENPAGTTGEGHARCREIARAALRAYEEADK